MSCQDKSAARRLERSFLGELDPEGLAELHRHLAGCTDCRARYDRQVAVERQLEPGAGPLPAAHLNLVGAAVMAKARQAATATTSRRWWRFSVGFAVPAASAALALAIFLVARPGGDGYQARSGAPHAIEGVRAFCIGQDGAGSRILSSASLGEEGPLRCGTAASLQFSYTTGAAPSHLAIVSLPQSGDGPVLVYTADDATLPVAARAVDEPLPYSTRLAARHVPAQRLLFALFFDGPRTTAQIEEAARSLARGEKPPAGVRVSLRSTLIVD